MAGTPKLYDVSEIHQNPGDLYIIGTPPTDSSPRLTLFSDGTPDATAHPSSICLGATEAGTMFHAKMKMVDIKIDQADAPVDKYGEETECSIEAELSQQAVDKLQNAMSTGVYSTASGYKQLTFGGIATIPAVCVAMISAKRTGSGLFLVSMLYRCASIGGFTIEASRKKKSMHKATFAGMTDIARTAGRQIGIHYETV